MAKRLRELDDLPVTVLKGVGPERAKVLAKIDISTIFELLTHYPRRYLDKTKQTSIRDARVDEAAWVFGRVASSSTVPGRGRGKARTELKITDGSGYLGVTFFNQPWRARQFPEGSEAMFFGKITEYRGRLQLANPEVDLLDEADRLQITAIYPQSDKLRLYSKDFRGWIGESLRRSTELVEPLPGWILDRHDLVDRTAAFHGIHAPQSMREAEEARRRLAFDELLRIQLALVLRKRRIEATSQGIEHVVSGELVERFLGALPFALTGDQERVIAEITADLARPIPMHRLLQGDVGAGKTVVAVAALLTAVQGGHQGAFMAPTEVLAEQHLASIRPMVEGITIPDAGASLFGDRPLTVELLTNKVAGKERQRILTALEAGEVDLLVGTHALIQDGGRVPQPRRGRDRRAAPLRRGAAGRAQGQGRRCGARRARDDGHPHPAHRGDDGLRRPRRLGARGEAGRTPADRHHVGRRRGRGVGGLGEGPRGGRGRPPGVRGLPADRRERQARGGVGRGDLRPTRGGRPERAVARAAARAPARGREGRGDAALPQRRHPGPRGHHGDRGRRRRPQRHRDGGPRRRPLRHRAAPPAPRPGRPGRRRVVLLPRHHRRRRRGRRGGAGAGQRPARGARPHGRRLRAGRGRPRDPGRGHGLRRAPEGPQRPEAGVAATRPRGRAAGPRRRGRRWSTPTRRSTGTPSSRTSSASSSTRRTRPSSSSPRGYATWVWARTRRTRLGVGQGPGLEEELGAAGAGHPGLLGDRRRQGAVAQLHEDGAEQGGDGGGGEHAPIVPVCVRSQT